MLSGHSLRLTSGHNRWSIHAISRDQKMLLHLQRGEPAVWMHPADMADRGIEDHSKGCRGQRRCSWFDSGVGPHARTHW